MVGSNKDVDSRVTIKVRPWGITWLTRSAIVKLHDMATTRLVMEALRNEVREDFTVKYPWVSRHVKYLSK